MPTWSQKGPDWSPEGVQNDPKMALKTCLKFGRFPRSILGAFLMDFRIDSDGKNTRKQWRGHQNQGFRTLSPDIVLDPILGRFWAQIWVIFGPKIDPKSIQKMNGDFGTQKDAKWDAQRSQKVVQNGLTPIELSRVGVEWGSSGHMSGSRAPRKHSLVMIYNLAQAPRASVGW